MFACFNGGFEKNFWCLDSGATAHLCCDKSSFIKFERHTEKVVLAGNNYIVAIGRGTVQLNWRESTVDLVTYSMWKTFNAISYL